MINETELWPQPAVDRLTLETSRGPVDLLESGSGPPILSFHGTGAGNDVVPIMDGAVVEDGFRLIVPNRPGYFGTPLSCGRSPEEHADLAAELLDQLGVRRAAVVGTSGGGPAATCFAARHAARTVALVLQCAVCHPFASPRWMPRHLRWWFPLFRLQRVFLPILRFGFRREMRKLRRDPEQMLKDMCGPRYAELRDDPRARELGALLTEAELRCAEQPEGVENDWATFARERWLEAGSIGCPTLILHDPADPMVVFAHAEQAMRCIPQAELCELHVGGHMIWVGQDAERMRQERTAFLRRHL